MAYGTLYYNSWSDKYGQQYNLTIDKKDYLGSSYRMPLVDGYSLNHTYRGGRDEEYNAVHGSELNFSVWANNDAPILTDLQLLRDTAFSGGTIWQQLGSGSLPWIYTGGNYEVEVDGGDNSNYLYQNCAIVSGNTYKLEVSYTMDDANTNHELGVNFANSNAYTGNQFYPFNVDDETFDGVTTLSFVANGNYSKVGLMMSAGGATAVVRSFKLYLVTEQNYDQMMEADYNEYKTTLIHHRQLIDNSTFKDHSSTTSIAYWASSGGSGVFSWEYNNTIKAMGVTADGLSWSDMFNQNQVFMKGKEYKVKIHFAVDNNWNQSKFALNFFDDPDYDPPETIILLSGSSGLSYYNPDVDLIDSESSSIVPFGMEYWIEYTFVPTYSTRTSIGFSFSSGDESCYVFSFEVWVDETVFTGWVKPDNITKSVLKDQYFVNINCIDGIADLRNLEYFVQSSRAPMIEVLEECLNYTGLNLPFLIQTNLRSNHGAFDYAAFDCEVDKRRWITDKRGKKSYASCYQVIEDILTPFHCRLIQQDGCWLIQNTTELNTRREWYQTGSTVYAGISNRVVDITPYAFIPDGDELSKIPPAKGIEVSVDNVQYDDSFVENGRFDIDLSGWTTHGEAFTNFQRISADEDAYLRTRRVSANDFTTMYFSGMTYLPCPSNSIGLGDSFSISMDLLVVTPTVDAQRPELRVNAWRDYTTNVGEQKQLVLNATDFPTNQWCNVSFDFQTWADMRSKFPTPIKVDIGLYTPSAGNNQTTEVYFDNIKLEYDFNKDVDDKTKLEFVLEDGNPLLQTIQQELKIGDGFYTNDISKITTPTGKPTSGWTSSDFVIVRKPLVELFARERARQNLAYRNYLRLTVIDEEYKVNANSIVKFKDRQYKVIGFNRNFMFAQTDLELAEYVKGTIPEEVFVYYAPSFTAFDY